MTNSSSSIPLPNYSSIVEERTPCLAGNAMDSDAELTSASSLNQVRTSKRFAIAWAAMAILLILSACSSGSPTTTNSNNSNGRGFSMTWENQRQQQQLTNNPSSDDDSNDYYDLSFDDFLVKFDKSYASKQDYEYRKSIYESNVLSIQSHNENVKDHGWTMGINQFADLLPQEIHKGLDKSGLMGSTGSLTSSSVDAKSTKHLPFASLFSNHESEQLRKSSHTQARSLLSDLPDAVDWRTHDPPIVTPIKNQGLCGSCWAFAATAVLESHAALASKELFVLSPQELVSCAPNPNHCGGDGGCTGSTGELAYDYVAKHGMVTEWEYGYTSYQGVTGTCQLKDWHFRHGGFLATKQTLQGAKVGVVGYSSLPTNSYEALMQAVATLGPVVVSVAANGWGLYNGGVFDDYDSVDNYDTNHAVVLEGYGTDADSGQDYWLVRNSWGVQWGENGYIRLKRNGTTDEQRCKLDITPSHGVACEGPDKNATIPDQTVCGTSGILYANVVPVGTYLIQNWL